MGRLTDPFFRIPFSRAGTAKKFLRLSAELGQIRPVREGSHSRLLRYLRPANRSLEARMPTKT
jgi:hypothetical protein